MVQKVRGEKGASNTVGSVQEHQEMVVCFADGLTSLKNESKHEKQTTRVIVL